MNLLICKAPHLIHQLNGHHYTFFSNYFNHHQKALCDEWYSILGDGFAFVETQPIEGFRSTMGWGKDEVPPYVLRTYADDASHKRAMELGLMSDLVVMGTAPELYIEERLKQDKIIFRYLDKASSGFVYKMLNIPNDLYTPLFAASRIAGWSAHRIEELINSNKIIRPA